MSCSFLEFILRTGVYPPLPGLILSTHLISHPNRGVIFTSAFFFFFFWSLSLVGQQFPSVLLKYILCPSPSFNSHCSCSSIGSQVFLIGTLKYVSLLMSLGVICRIPPQTHTHRAISYSIEQSVLCLKTFSDFPIAVWVKSKYLSVLILGLPHQVLSNLWPFLPVHIPLPCIELMIQFAVLGSLLTF